MMNVLDMLKYRLAPSGAGASPAMPSPQEMAGLRQRQQAWEAQQQQQQQLSALPEADRRLRAMGPVPPSYLPDAVWDSILNRPVYDEQSNIPRRINPRNYSDFDRELDPQRNPHERERLKDELDWKRFQFPQMDFPMPDGATAAPTPLSPYSSPLNSMLGRRGPFALY
jgi:hypothetical protein